MNTLVRSLLFISINTGSPYYRQTMKKYLSILLILLGGSAVRGGLNTRHQSSLQLTVEPARTISWTRVGNTYSISGTNVNTSHTPSGENA